MDKGKPISSEERTKAVAAILARGVARAKEARRHAEHLTPQESCPQSQIPLELPGETRLSVATGSGG